MPCYTAPPSCTSEEWMQHMFMQIFKITPELKAFCEIDICESFYSELTRNMCLICQMMSPDMIRLINGLDIYQNLYDWYISHILHDFSKNRDDEKEVKRCKEEAARFGLTLSIDKNGAAHID